MLTIFIDEKEYNYISTKLMIQSITGRKFIALKIAIYNKSKRYYYSFNYSFNFSVKCRPKSFSISEKIFVKIKFFM